MSFDTAEITLTPAQAKATIAALNFAAEAAVLVGKTDKFTMNALALWLSAKNSLETQMKGAGH